MPVKRERGGGGGSRKRRATTEDEQPIVKAEAATAASTPSVSSLPAGVTAVRLLWTDLAGLRRCRVIPASRWPGVACGSSPVRLARACAALQSTVDACCGEAEISGVVGDVSLFPVRPAARLPWCGAHAVALCERRKLPDPEEEGVEGWRGEEEGEERREDEDPKEEEEQRRRLVQECFSLCARGTARRAELVAARASPPMAFRFGFETEFKLSRRNKEGSGEFADPGSYCHSAVLDAHLELLDAIVSAVDQLLCNAGIDDARVEQWHVEAGDGAGSGSAVFEVVTSHAALVDACDALVLTREAISQVARRGGFDAIFLPKPDGDGAAGLGCHAHFSAYRKETGENLTFDVTGKWRRRRLAEKAAAVAESLATVMAEATAAAAEPTVGESLAAGVCSRVRALLFFTACGPTSHLRLKPNCWSGAPSADPRASDWGPANKEAPLRVLRDRCEFKPADATANPYLAAAALVSAALAGVARGERLPPPRKATATTTSPSSSAPAASAPPPSAADEAEAALRRAEAALGEWASADGGGLFSSRDLFSIFTQEAISTLIALRHADLEAMRGWSYEKIRERLSLLY